MKQRSTHVQFLTPIHDELGAGRLNYELDGFGNGNYLLKRHAK